MIFVLCPSATQNTLSSLPQRGFLARFKHGLLSFQSPGVPVESFKVLLGCSLHLPWSDKGVVLRKTSSISSPKFCGLPLWILLFINTWFPGSTSVKEPAYQCRRCKRNRFSPWIRKIPWRRVWQPTPVLLPGKFYGQRSGWATVLRITELGMTETEAT